MASEQEIRADERAEVEAEVVAALSARVDWYRVDAECAHNQRSQDFAQVKREAIIEVLTYIESGKHRSKP